MSAWALTAELSPRPRVRVAVEDVEGTTLNVYSSTAAITGPAPEGPWAVMLADRDGRFHLIAFDLDAKAGSAAAAEDARTISEYLTRFGIEHVVCESGPTGGRHVWIALAEPADAQLVKDLGISFARACPSLDRTPISNPSTGSVRPPGAPHRLGGHSRVLSGDVAALTTPTTTPAQLVQLASQLNTDYPVDSSAVARPEAGPLPVDETGQVYLPGPRRPLPAGSAEALHQDVTRDTDASAVLWRVLIGAAAARWRYADVAALLSTAPGLEHARTERRSKGSAQRRPRPVHGSHSSQGVLRAQWTRAVRRVATTPRQVGEDPTFEPRAQAIAEHVDQVQTRADASVGRWTRGGGPSDRRILDTLCLLALQAVSASVEADTRRLAVLAGVGRETARTALLRLAESGWITRTRGADGPNGAHWTIDPQNAIHSNLDTARSQAGARPAGAAAAHRDLLITTLTTRLQQARHDVFTCTRAVGLHAGNTYARLSLPLTLEDVALATAQTMLSAQRTLHRLASCGLVRLTRAGWTSTHPDERDRVAVQLGVDGRLAARADAYTVERVHWGWWQAEVLRLSSPGKNGNKRPARHEQQAFVLGRAWDRYPAYPRTADGRPDHEAARIAIRTGLLPQFYELAA